MEDTLVTIATYRFPQKADLARSMLEHEGIQAFVADGNAVTADWLLGNAIGYAKLQVRSSQAEVATGFLRAHPGLLDSAAETDSDEESGPDTCLACGAEMLDDAGACNACGWTYESDVTPSDQGEQPSDEAN